MKLLCRSNSSPIPLLALAIFFATLGRNSSSFSLPYSKPGNQSTHDATSSSNRSSNPDLRTALYPRFNNPKMQRIVDGLNRDLEAESLRRNGTKRDEKMEKIEDDLSKARALIWSQNHEILEDESDYIPHGEIYRNSPVFHRSYLLMERLFKIFIYEEGEPPLFHTGPFSNIYSLEGILISSIEKNSGLRTRNPDEAHVYFLPFSVVKIVDYLFDSITRDKAVLERVIGDYLRLISTKYPYWNRSLGSDHFMVSCHDWGPRATWYVHQLYFTSIRALCNANTSEFFNPRKDVSFPEINLNAVNSSGLIGGYPPSNRTLLAFFAGGLHGRIRPSLFQHWKGKDEDIKVFEYLPANLSYQEMMKKSRYCLCPSGHEVASPRIVEAIYAECIPVLISQNYTLPFSDVLNWSAFSIALSVEELPNLKSILLGVSEDRYLKLLDGVKQVQRHFMINDPPERYDVFHMAMHSIWLRRLNVRIYG